MIAWLQQDLGIDYKKVSIKSFVHMKHDLCVEIDVLLCERVDYNPNTLFTSQRWYICKECECGGICEHGKSGTSARTAKAAEFAARSSSS